MHFAGLLIAGPVVHSHALWRNPKRKPGFLTLDYYAEIARTLERGKFDLVFFADRLAIADKFGDDKTIGIRHGDQDSTRMDPVPILSAIAAVTGHLGLGATRSTTYDLPYHIAREFRTLDHLSGGRAAWNVVTSMNDSEAQNFGIESHLDHDQRYDRADEFVDVVTKLWDSWEPDALVLDRAHGIYADPGKVRYLDHKGRYFQVRGPLNIPASPQGRPVIIQAGSSDRGRSFAAKWAEVIFNISPNVDVMKRFTAMVRGDMAAIGRPEANCKVLMAVMPFVGSSTSEAEEKRAAHNALVDPMVGLCTLSAHANVDLAALDLDAKVENLKSSGTQGNIAMVSRIAKEKGMTLKDVGRRYGESVMVPQVVGTAKQVADELAEIVTSGAADGFVVSPGFLPDSFVEFVDEVVPELQRLGVLRRDYKHATLRDNLTDP